MRTIKKLIPVLAFCGGILIGAAIFTAANPAMRTMVMTKMGFEPAAATASLQITETGNGQEMVTETATSGVMTANNANAVVSPELALAVIADYKQDLAIFFDAWKAVKMDDFRFEISKAYTGALLEEHVRQAEEYLLAGIGLDITDIEFSQIAIESADINTATLNASYSYLAQDYNLVEQTLADGQYKHSVHVRVNMLKINGRWLIAGETPIQ